MPLISSPLLLQAANKFNQSFYTITVMPKFISIPVTDEHDPLSWKYAQEADTLEDLENNSTYDGISRMNKRSWSGERAGDTVRTIYSNAGSGSIEVVSYKRT